MTEQPQPYTNDPQWGKTTHYAFGKLPGEITRDELAAFLPINPTETFLGAKIPSPQGELIAPVAGTGIDAEGNSYTEYFFVGPDGKAANRVLRDDVVEQLPSQRRNAAARVAAKAAIAQQRKRSILDD